ncbi:MAG: SRPBCC family protein [Gaiellaceae bacterium]
MPRSSCGASNREVPAINETIEIGRPPQEVFAYVSDMARHPEWQEKLLAATVETEGPTRAGTRVKQTRRVGRGTRTFTLEVTEQDPPNRLAFRGVDGPVRPQGTITLEPLDGGQRTRYSAQLDFEGHGLGLLLAPLVRRDARRQLPDSLQRLKQKLEAS